MQATLLFFLFSLTCFAKNPVYRYEPDKVTLEGTLELQTFPGRPNYESIKGGDEIETQWFMRLGRAIDIETNPLDTTGPWDPEKNVKVVQVIIDDKDWKKVGKGKRIRATGILTHAITGHHHARVLLDIQKMIVLRP